LKIVSLSGIWYIVFSCFDATANVSFMTIFLLFKITAAVIAATTTPIIMKI